MSRLIKVRRKSATPPQLVMQQEENNEMDPLISDATCNLNVVLSGWEGLYQLFENEKHQVILDRKVVANDTSSNDAKS